MFPRRPPEASAAFREGCGARGDGERADGPRPFSSSLTRARAREFAG